MKKLVFSTEYKQEVSDLSLSYNGSALKKCARFTEGAIYNSSAANLSCLSRFSSANPSPQAALALAALCFSASTCLLAPVSRGAAALSSPCVVFCAVSLCTTSGVAPAPGGIPPWGSPAVSVSSTRLCTCCSSKGAPTPFVLRVVHLPSLLRPYRIAGVSLLPTQTLLLKPHRKQLA